MKHRAPISSDERDYAPSTPAPSAGLWCPIGNAIAGVLLAVALAGSIPLLIVALHWLPDSAQLAAAAETRSRP